MPYIRAMRARKAPLHLVELYWATNKEQLAENILEQNPHRTLPAIRAPRWGEKAMHSQPTIAGKPEHITVRLGPNLPPQ